MTESFRLIELHPQFQKYEERDGSIYRVNVRGLAEAQGIQFLCPLCFKKNGGAVGTHQVVCWFVGKVPDHALPGPGRWTPQGTGFHDLSFVPGDPPRAKSVLLTAGCRWHGHVTQGMVTLE